MFERGNKRSIRYFLARISAKYFFFLLPKSIFKGRYCSGGFLADKRLHKVMLSVILVSVFWFLIVCKTFLELEPKISSKSTYACKWGKVLRATMQKSVSFHERYIEGLFLCRTTSFTEVIQKKYDYYYYCAVTVVWSWRITRQQISLPWNCWFDLNT